MRSYRMYYHFYLFQISIQAYKISRWKFCINIILFIFKFNTDKKHKWKIPEWSFFRAIWIRCWYSTRRMRLDRKPPLWVPGEKPGKNNKKGNSLCQHLDALITRVSVNFHDLSIFAKYPINCRWWCCRTIISLAL